MPKIICIVFILLVIGCEDEPFYTPEIEIRNLSDASVSLNAAIQEGKIVKSILPLNGQGWIIRFTDNTSLHFVCNNNSVPYITNDSVGERYISYDEGETYTIYQNELEHSPHTIIRSIEENNADFRLMVTLVDGKVYTLPKSPNVLLSFSILKDDNPDNNFDDLHYHIGTNSLKVLTPYVLDKTHLVARFSVPDSCKVYVKEKEQKSGVTEVDFTDGADYHIVSPSGLHIIYHISIEGTGLPVVSINTQHSVPINSKDHWEKAEVSIVMPDGRIDFVSSDLQIRGRGNSSWGFPKKPYALKLNQKAEILGMPKHKRWLLLANWMDRTLLRNDFGFEISRRTNLAWTPRGTFVELLLNGHHQGNYYLCEQIKVGKNRVDIEDMEPNDVEGDALTGGYLLELDTNYDEENKFRSSTKNLPYMLKSPDEEKLQPAQFHYIQDYINRLESVLYAPDWLETRFYASYIDLQSFVDYLFVYELSMNDEMWKPKSVYMHKDRLGKLVAGPVWDFDWGTFKKQFSNRYQAKTALYYGQLFKDPQFVELVKSRWILLKPEFEKIPDIIRMRANQIKKSERFNHELWPITTSFENDDESLTFEDAIENMINLYQEKLSWLDKQIIFNL